MSISSPKDQPDENIPYNFIKNYLRQTQTQNQSFTEYSDFVLVFNLKLGSEEFKCSSNDPSDASLQNSGHDSATMDFATQALKALLKRITGSGLSVEMSTFGPGKISLFITCPEDRIKQEYLSSKVHDYLHGMRVANTDQLFGSQNTKEHFRSISLTTSERIRLVHEILTDPVDEGGAGILVSQDPCIECMYPVHDRKFNRAWLKKISTKWRVNFEDLSLVKDHFGEELAYYFAFVDFYFSWLLFPSVIGLLFYFYGGTSSTIHGILNLAWATIFVEAWSRKQADLAVKWEVNNVSRVEKTRPEFKITNLKKNHIGSIVPHVPIWKSWIKKLASIPIIFFLGGILFLLVVLSFIVEIIINDYYNGPFKFYMSILPGVVYILLVNSFSGFYTKLSHRLTFFENHRTVSEHSFYLTQKTFIVNFLVSYLSIFLVAWVYIPYCDEITEFLRYYFPLSSEVTRVGLGRLQAQLFFYVITSQVINFFTETVVPIVLRYSSRTARETTRKVKDRIQEHMDHQHGCSDDEDETRELLDADVPISEGIAKGLTHSQAVWSLKKFEFEYQELIPYDTYDDYAEMIIQFGYIVIFSVVLPLAAVVSYANNWVELRSDSLKIVLSHRRPVPRRVENIGAWLDNMIFLIWVGSFVNGLLVYQFSYITKDLEGYRLILGMVIAVIWEHGWILFSRLTKSISANLPTFAETTIQSETYQLKTRLMEQSGILSEINQNQMGSSNSQTDPNQISPISQQGESLVKAWFERSDKKS